jgi:predicted DNA-binding transcriptional regulator AlpA
MPLNFDTQADSALIRQADLIPAVLPFSASSLWRRVRAGTFPAPTKLSERITAWRVGDVRRWLAEQVKVAA